LAAPLSVSNKGTGGAMAMTSRRASRPLRFDPTQAPRKITAQAARLDFAWMESGRRVVVSFALAFVELALAQADAAR
jgi:hypothetical protein